MSAAYSRHIARLEAKRALKTASRSPPPHPPLSSDVDPMQVGGRPLVASLQLKHQVCSCGWEGVWVNGCGRVGGWLGVR
jgi:hypothetical protein